jgi:hypothetical protein
VEDNVSHAWAPRYDHASGSTSGNDHKLLQSARELLALRVVGNIGHPQNLGASGHQLWHLVFLARSREKHVHPVTHSGQGVHQSFTEANARRAGNVQHAVLSFFATVKSQTEAQVLHSAPHAPSHKRVGFTGNDSTLSQELQAHHRCKCVSMENKTENISARRKHIPKSVFGGIFSGAIK